MNLRNEVPSTNVEVQEWYINSLFDFGYVLVPVHAAPPDHSTFIFLIICTLSMLTLAYLYTRTLRVC